MKKEVHFWFIFQALAYYFCGIGLAIYPAPGSYYSVLLRYNSHGKTRKVARIAPTPQRLWSYFNPPAALGALPLEAIDNNIGRHLRNRGMAGRLAETTERDDHYNTVHDIPPKKSHHIQKNKPSKEILSNNSQRPGDHHQLKHPEANYRKEDSNMSALKEVFPVNRRTSQSTESSIKSTIKNIEENLILATSEESNFMDNGSTRDTETDEPNVETNLEVETSTIPKIEDIKGTCGGAIKLSLTPIKSKNGDHGRFFQKTIMSIGFPNYYETRTRCLWTLEVSDECEMGTIVTEIQAGSLIQSPRCAVDSLTIGFNDKDQERLCGTLKGHIGSYKWTKSGYHLLNLTLKTMPRAKEIDFPQGQDWGFKLNLSGYCWVYSAAYLSRFIQKEVKSKTEPSLKPLHIKDRRPPNDSNLVLPNSSSDSINKIVHESMKKPTNEENQAYNELKETSDVQTVTPIQFENVEEVDTTDDIRHPTTEIAEFLVLGNLDTNNETSSQFSQNHSSTMPNPKDSIIPMTDEDSINSSDNDIVLKIEGIANTLISENEKIQTENEMSNLNGGNNEQENFDDAKTSTLNYYEDEMTTTSLVEGIEKTEFEGITSSPLALKW